MKSDNIERAGNIYYETFRAGFAGNVVHPNGISVALTTMGGVIENL